MSDIDKVKEIMGFGENFHMCDVSEIAGDHIHLESWNEDVEKDDFDLIAELIAADGYDVDGFELLEIPHPKVFCFGNLKTNQYFDVVNFLMTNGSFLMLKILQISLLIPFKKQSKNMKFIRFITEQKRKPAEPVLRSSKLLY